MKHAFLSGLLALCSAGCTSNGKTAAFDPVGLFVPRQITPQKIQKAMATFHQNHPEAPAAVFAVYSERRGLRFEGAVGVLGAGGKEPARAQDAFPFGEITQAFLGVLAARLAEEKRVRGDDLVPSDLGEEPLPLDTLLHGGGGPGRTGIGEKRYAANKGSYARASFEAVTRHLEKAGGKPIAALLREYVLNPLGLEHTWMLGAESPPPGTRLLPTPTVPSPQGLAGTAGDLARFEAQIRKGAPFKSATDTAARDSLFQWLIIDSRYAYGAGFERITADSGGVLVGHATAFGLNAFFFRLMEDDIVVAGAAPGVASAADAKLWPLLLERIEDLVASEREGIPRAAETTAPAAP